MSTLIESSAVSNEVEVVGQPTSEVQEPDRKWVFLALGVVALLILASRGGRR